MSASPLVIGDTNVLVYALTTGTDSRHDTAR